MIIKDRLLYLTIKTFAIVMSLYHIYNVAVGRIDPLLYRYTHLTMALFLGYLLLASKKEGISKVLSLVLGIVVIPVYIYLYFNFERIVTHVPTLDMPTTGDLIVGVTLIALILESTRRHVSWILALISLSFLIYALAGPFLPGILHHQGLSFAFVIDYLIFTMYGVFGSAIAVSSHYIILFMIFGSFLRVVGIGEYFTELASSLAGRTTGGPAKIAVISSAFIGSLIGGATSNVTITGIFTIPMMKQYGFRTNFAAAVEAASSTGGSILPPIMGSAAFLIAEILGVTYFEVVKASLIPAVLYYLAIMFMVHIQAVKSNLETSPNFKCPELSTTLKGAYKLLPLVIIITFLFRGYSPSFAGLAGISSCIILGFINGANRLTLTKIFDALEWASVTVIQIVLACAASGIIMGAVVLTGLSGKFTSILLQVSAGVEVLVLVFIMLSTIILGMGMAITPAYIMAAVLGAPALISLGFTPIASHLFIMYFAVLAPLTPPVAITAYVAAGIAQGNMAKTAVQALKLASVGFLIPYLFLYHNELLLIGGTADIIISIITAIIGIICFASGVQGFLVKRLNIYERIAAIGGGIFVIIPSLISDLAGLLVLSILFFTSRDVMMKSKPKTHTIKLIREGGQKGDK